MWYFIALCVLSVNAQNSTDSNLQKDSNNVKIEPKNISSFYIGDLLRTKPKDDLEVAGSIHQPQILNQDLLASASVPYKSHGGHDSEEARYHPIYPQARSVGSVERIGAQAPNVPFNVKGHILTLKPVRLVPASNIPTSRNSERSHKDAHYPGDDCSKNTDRSYSSEEKPYVQAPETYRRAKQTASNPELDYRSPPQSYYEDDRSEAYSSQSDPSSGTYRSKTYPSNTNSKSESSGSYTTSKSTSVSKTVTPKKSKSARVIPLELSNKENYNKNYGPSHRGQGFVVYKVKEPSNEKPGSYSEGSEKDYPSSDYDRDHKPENREPYYSQHSSGPRKTRKYSHGKQTHYPSSEPKERPQQYAPPHYEEDQGSYEQTPYRPDDDQRYREQTKPSDNYDEQKYTHQYSDREPENKPYQQNYPVQSEEQPYSNPEQNSKSYHTKKQPKTTYEKPSKRGRYHSGSKSQSHSTSEYDPPLERQSERGQKEIPHRNHDIYPAQYGHTEAPQSYDRTQQTSRPSAKQYHQYDYQATTQTSPKQSEIHSSQRRPYRESSRYVRSPEEPSATVEGRTQLPVPGKEAVVMITRESKPFVSRSESTSESSYNMNPKENRKSDYGQTGKFQTIEGRYVSSPNFQTNFKPFNPEYSRSYPSNPHQNVDRKHTPRTHQRPYGPPESYNAPVYSHTQSHSGEAPQQHQQGPYQDEEPYDQDDNNQDSYEEGGKPIKKGKNHHYISKVEGYKDTYGKDEPLVIDEEFFRKYGISPSAKVIVANAENPNLFVADGSNIKEGEYFKNGGPKYELGPSYQSKPDSDYGPSSGPNYDSGPDSGYGPSSVNSEENYEPGYKSDFKEDSYSNSQEELGSPKEIPGSFDDLVDTNPKFLRHLPELMKNDDRFFKMDSSEASFDDVEFPKFGEQRGYIVSQKPGEIVQQHGDGVSRIIFNIPKVEDNEERSNAPKMQVKEEIEERIVEAATNLVKDIIKSHS